MNELWDVSTWPSPSPEDVVRARVLGRARTITRRRLAPVLVALLLASAAAVQDMTRMETSSKVHVTDTPAPAAKTPPVDLSAGITGTGLPAAPGTGPVAGAPTLPRRARQSSSSARGDEGRAGPGPASRQGPLATDPSGDAVGGIVCAYDDCASNVTESQAAVDLLHGDLVSDSTSMTATVSVLDMSAAPSANAATGTHLGYGACFYAGDPNRHSKVCVWALVHRLDQSVSATGEVYSDSDSVGVVTRPVRGVVASVDRAQNAATVTVALAELNAALTAVGSKARIAEGTVLLYPRFAGAFVTKTTDGYVPRWLDSADSPPERLYRVGD